MTRVKISFAIIIALIGISIFSGIWVNRRCDDMIAGLYEINDISGNGDISELREKAKRLNRDWEDFRSKASVLIKYDKLVEIDRLCSRIGELAGKDDAELVAELSELHDMLEMLKNGETPLLTSVF
jgi:hypothetical protein